MTLQVIELIHKHVYLVVAVLLFAVSTTVIIFLLFKLNSKVKTVTTTQGPVEFTDSSDGEGDIFIDVAGAVQKPGLYKINKTAHLADLITLSGGFAKNADALWISRKLNLAAHLKDSDKIYVPFEWDTLNAPETINTITCAELSEMDYDAAVDYLSSESTISDKQLADIKINSATLEELDTLPGIGKTYAQKIIDNRPYTSAKDLIDKAKISQNVISKIEALISFDD